MLIGRPLEVTVPVQLEGSADAVPECAQAEVFYGDAKIPASTVNAEMQLGAAGPVVRVRSGAVINEPVVTVYLQVGCGNKFTRRLVLLAEPDPTVDVQRPFPSVAAPERSKLAEAAVNAAPSNLSMRSDAAVPVPALAAPAPKPAQPPRHKRASPTTEAPSKAGRAASGVPAAPSKQVASSPVPPQAAPTAPASRDRLTLDVPVGPAEPSPPSEEAIRQAARLQAIERDLRDMRQFLQRSDVAMLRLQTQLAKAESERYANPLVYALAALLAVMAALLAYLWRRAAVARDGTAANWWHAPSGERSGRRAVPASVAHVAGSRNDKTGKAAASPANATDSGAEGDAEGLVPSVPRVPPVASRTDDFQTSQGTRALKAEELHDVQQEADFFSSLGEYDRAIEVLRGHIQAHPETSAVAWLDLVEIYHKLGRREEFDWVRREFQRRFNADVPTFDEYSQESAGIEAYDNAMARIAALWPARRVLDVIEESIFRGPSKDGTQAFSLQAYRELLLLHHIGQQVLVGSATPPSVFGDASPASSHGFSHTSIHPLSTGLAALDQQPATQISDSQPATLIQDQLPDFVLEDLDLDLNLDEPAFTQQVAPRSAHLLDFDLPDLIQADLSKVARARG
ncbi:type IV pilus assembly protein FimV [Ramlibacter sp. MMS24-I3-19]|uniref:type IV pilus assembly protein FimV n=1 Tax=Ramlibacter sp. MMS24-I3-19 TaxID=3416606 RepID=UPI003D032A05